MKSNACPSCGSPFGLNAAGCSSCRAFVQLAIALARFRALWRKLIEAVKGRTDV